MAETKEKSEKRETIGMEEALTYLYEAEALVKTTAVPGEAACGRALLSVAALANAGR